MALSIANFQALLFREHVMVGIDLGEEDVIRPVVMKVREVRRPGGKVPAAVVVAITPQPSKTKEPQLSHLRYRVFGSQIPVWARVVLQPGCHHIVEDLGNSCLLRIVYLDVNFSYTEQTIYIVLGISRS